MWNNIIFLFSRKIGDTLTKFEFKNFQEKLVKLFYEHLKEYKKIYYFEFS